MRHAPSLPGLVGGAAPAAPAFGAGGRGWLVAVTAGVVLAVCAGAGLISWQLHDSALADARRNTARLGIAIAEQTTRSLQAADLVLDGVRADLLPLPGEPDAAYAERLSGAPTHAMLQLRAEGLPQVAALTVALADGRMVASSRRYPMPPVDISGRDSFQHAMRGGTGRGYVGPPVTSADTGARNAYLVRPLNGPDGRPRAVVAAALDLGYMEEFFRALTAGGNTMAGLVRRDGTVLARTPPAPDGTKLPEGSPWYAIAGAGPGTYTGVPVNLPGADPGPQVISVHPLADYPLVVNVGVPRAEALATWRRTSLLAAACLAGGTLCILLLLRALLVQIRHLAESRASLAQQNGALEATRHCMEAQAAERRASRARLARSSAALETTLGHMDQGIMTVEADRTVSVCNRRAMEMLNLPRELMESHPSFDDVVAHQHGIGEFSLPGAAEAARYDWSRIVMEAQTYERVRPCGRVMEVHSIPLARGGMVRTYTDVTERRRSEERALYLAHHDGLTGLANRTAFGQRLAAAVPDAGPAGGAAVLYLDLDGFKLVNDTYGHGTGDRLLAEVARRLAGTVPEPAMLARMGGDEFAILLPLEPPQPGGPGAGTPGTPPAAAPAPDAGEHPGQLDEEGHPAGLDERHPAGLEGLARRILGAFAEPYTLGDVQCRLGVSIGVALCPGHAVTAEELLRHADTALYRAKATGKGTYCTYDAALDGQQQLRLLLEQDLRQALPGGELFLEYQPIVDARTLRVLRHEALVRWRHPRRGLVGPADFIGLAERSGLIVPIGLWVLEAACAEAAGWPAGVQVSVNLSPAQLVRADFPDQVASVLARTGLAPSRLNLEVTEGMLLDDTEGVLRAMSALRASGVRFSLDDFGTAHAGLTYLRRFPFDVIKIDKSFVQDAAAPDGVGAAALVIIAAIVGIGRAFGLAVVAEGVETQAQLDLVRDMGCAEVQGYLTGRPGLAVRPPGGQVDGPKDTGAVAASAC